MKMRKPKQEIILTDVEITDAGSEGNAIAKIDGRVIFVPFVVPGDVCDIKLYKTKKNYAEGRAIEIKKYSPLRAEVQCPHFGVCGGCRWQNMIYSEQLKTLNYAIGQILAAGVTRTGASCASTVIMMMVPIIVFIVSQSNIIETMGTSGMKD